MIFEREHSDLKEVAVGTTSSRNLPETIAIRNSLRLCYLKEFTDGPTEDTRLGSVINEKVSCIELRTKIPGFEPDSFGKIYRNIEVLGKNYTDDTVFFLRFDEHGDPVFTEL
ncbi:hypothetical protein QAD02_013261 [Eretmocerus hayati]|uniref:Uncharacterized protein n=1 Tax=Eretmocerus hayati TaxID=131215 RepID=A0ACC2P2E2_9HYME|nr:hypothetical protein QAD02_013261 [Eretmocerus hayati]